MTRVELEAGGVLCEQQTLVAPIHPGDDLKVSFRVVTPGDVDLCFDDDDAEEHEVSLLGTSVRAHTPCRMVSLPAGDHTLGLRHAIRDARGTDDRPDVLHTKWTPPTSTSRGRLQVTSNACRGCTLKGAWPMLAPGVFGYAGDYTEAIIDGPCVERPTHCQLGGNGITSSFDRAQIVIDHNGPQNRRFLGDVLKKRALATFRGATVHSRETTFGFNVDASGAKFIGDGSLLFAQSDLTGADLTEHRGGPSLQACRMDVVTYSALGRASLSGNTVTIPKGQSLAGLVIDSIPDGTNPSDPNVFVWPLDENGILSMPRASFEKATLRNLTLPCPHGGDLRGASFAGATLGGVSFTGCNLTDASFAGATLTNVTAAKNTVLARADLTNVKVDGLDVTEASLSEATLTNAPNSPWKGLVARGLTAGSLTAQRLVTVLDGKGQGPDFSFADLTGADFSLAQLPRAKFGGATLTTTDFSNATIVGASFDNANGTRPVFEKADLASSAVAPTSLRGARFEAPNFHGASLARAKLNFARVCGGDFGGANLLGADLTGTLMPVVSDRFTLNGEPLFDCVAIKDLATIAIDATTTCPDGTQGPCSGTAWIPPTATAHCPGDPTRKTSGSSCTTACECTLLKCLNGTCG